MCKSWRYGMKNALDLLREMKETGFLVTRLPIKQPYPHVKKRVEKYDKRIRSFT